MPGVRRESEETGIMTWAPEKYIRDADDERGRVSMRLSAAVPVVDLGRLLAGAGDEMENLRRACAEWGMFHLTNHGISAELMGSLRRAGREFFLRDDDAALAERRRISAARRGDMQGYGQTYAVPDSKQLDWGDLLSLVMCPVSSRDYTAWPANPPELRRLVETYHSEVMGVGSAVVAAIARAGRLPPEKMLSAFGLDGGDGDGDDGAVFVKMRMNMYPACEWADRVNGLSPHADMAGLTVLMQDETEVGLHVFKDGDGDRDGEWVGVRPVPGALVVMVGNMMELLSNGIFRSVVHRAVPNRRSHRLSVPVFFSPPLDSLVVPLLPKDEDNDGSRAGTSIPLFREFIHKEYVQFYVSRRAVEGKTSFYDFAALPHHPQHPSNAASAS